MSFSTLKNISKNKKALMRREPNLLAKREFLRLVTFLSAL